LPEVLDVGEVAGDGEPSAAVGVELVRGLLQVRDGAR
jgi:hypothetical protein